MNLIAIEEVFVFQYILLCFEFVAETEINNNKNFSFFHSIFLILNIGNIFRSSNNIGIDAA